MAGTRNATATTDKLIQHIMDDLDSVRHGKDKPWIFDENGKVSENVFVFDTMKLLEALKDSDVVLSYKDFSKAVAKKFNEYVSENGLEEKRLDVMLDRDTVYMLSDKSDNTYNYDCNLSNDIDWYEIDTGTEEYGRIALMKFHIAGDVRCNYTDELAIKLGDYSSLMEYLWSEMDETISEHRYITVDGKEYSIDIDALKSGVEVYDTENWENICTCYDVEKKDIINQIREETAPMQSFNKGDVKKENTQDKGVAKE